MLKIKRYKKVEPVYDITVAKFANFFANKILVHNCSEIFLSSSADESFVCDLSSINLDKWGELKDTDAIKVLIYFLDAVMTEFISKTEGVKYMEAPHKFAVNQRALGLGVLGWHSYLQQHNIAFESMEAKMENSSIFETIKQQCDEATQELAAKFGEPSLLKGYGKRNVTTVAVAPTTSCTTANTKFKLEDGSCVDYFEYCKLGGLNLNDIMTIEIEMENNKTINLNYNDKIIIKRTLNQISSELEIFAYEIEDGDDIIDLI